MGAGRWADKAVVGGIATFVTLGILLVPVSIRYMATGKNA